MAVKIRLTRMGDKKSPFYRVVVTDSRSPRDGRFIDLVGTYNPLPEKPEIKLDTDKIKQWIANGAQPTETVKAILADQGIIEKKPLPAKTKTAKKKKE